jgi:hypothetical protein
VAPRTARQISIQIAPEKFITFYTFSGDRRRQIAQEQAIDIDG